MHSVITDPAGDPAVAEYEQEHEQLGGCTVDAEFYDILQAARDRPRMLRLYGAEVRAARLGILDVGAGTGRVTLMSLKESRVQVHAVEPARSMRAALMTRLGSLPSALRGRVTVHPHALHDTGLRAVADVAVSHDTIAWLPPSARRCLWPAVAEALVPGGSLLLQLPPARLPARETIRALPSRKVGRHVYEGRMVTSADTGRIRTRCDYWVRGVNGVLREHSETLWMWPASRAELTAELTWYGFAPLPEHADHTVLAVRRSS